MFLIIIQQNIYCVARCFFIQGHWVWCWMNYSKNMKNDECISELMFMLQNKSIVLNCSFHHVQRNKKWGVEFCLQHYLLVRILRLIFIPTFSLIIKKKYLSNSESQFLSLFDSSTQSTQKKIVVDSCSSLGFSFSLQICTLARPSKLLLSSTTNTHSSDNTVQIVCPSHPLPRLQH